MEDLLRFFRAYELWIYLVLAIGGLIYVRKFILAWEEMRAAAFGLERESAQSRLNQSAGMAVLLLMIGIAVFAVVTFVAPSFPGSNPLLTPTLDLLATHTATLVAEADGAQATQEAGQMEAIPSPSPTGVQIVGEGCVPGQIMISSPHEGVELSGVITIKGTANIANFGFYKYEVARPDDDVWLTIQAGREIKQENDLGQWDTRTLSPGDYMLRLVVTDNQGNSLPPCVIQVRVNNPVETAGP
jgi:hypothetical protein